jgi:autotransporter family porin
VKTSKLEDDRTRQTYGLLNVHHEFLDSKGMSANNWYCPGTTQKCSVSENFGNAWAEAGIGSQGWISKSTSVFGDMRYQWGLSHKLEGYSVNLGIRHMF